MLESVASLDEQTQTLAEAVRAASSSDTRLNVVGGNSRSWLGRSLANSHEEVLSTESLTGVLSYEPSELVIRVGAGTRIADITALLDSKQQMLAFEPHDIAIPTPSAGTSAAGGVSTIEGTSTIGGAIASGMAGASRPWLGEVKDHVLGLGLINGQGEALQFGGQVMKNVAGYDVSRAMVGSLGCFGVITDVSLKVLPKPQLEKYVSYNGTLSSMLGLAKRLDSGMTMRTGVAWKSGVAHLRFSGSERAIAEVMTSYGLHESDSQESEQEFWASMSSMALYSKLDRAEIAKGQEEGLGLWRLVAPKYTDLTQLFSEERLTMDWAGAQYWVMASEDELLAMLPKINALGVHCYSLNEDNIYTLQAMPSVVARLHSSLKNAFDPKGVLNVGRMSGDF